MPDPRPSAIVLAQAVVASELAENGSVGLQRVTTKLGVSLGRLIGSAGCDVLVARALTLAARQDPTLAGLSAASDGRVVGLPDDPAEQERCIEVVLAQLVELLMKFIGEDLAMRVFREVWPARAEERRTKETNI